MEEVRNAVRAADAKLNLLHADNKITNEQRLAPRLVIWNRFQDAQVEFAEKSILEPHAKILQTTDFRC